MIRDRSETEGYGYGMRASGGLLVRITNAHS